MQVQGRLDSLKHTYLPVSFWESDDLHENLHANNI